MKIILHILVPFALLLSYSYVWAASSVDSVSNIQNTNIPTLELKTGDKVELSKGYSQIEEEKAEQKNDTENKKEKAKLIKDVSAIVVDWYKTKLTKIFSSLETSVKDEGKEDKIKIYYNLLSNVNSKIELIDSKKVSLSDNKKEVFRGVLVFIKDYAQDKIKDFAKEK